MCGVRAVEFAEQVKRCETHARLAAIQAADDQHVSLWLVEHVGSVEQAVNDRIAVTCFE